MSLKFYYTTHCPRCREAKKLLIQDEHEFTAVNTDTDEGYAQLEADCARLELAMPKLSPILVTDDMLYSGGDVVIALEEGEI
jgi:glutaredoxin